MIGQWLLRDFRMHTDFSDGSLCLNEVVNLNGMSYLKIMDTPTRR
jgi:hypothetical protein